MLLLMTIAAALTDARARRGHRDRRAHVCAHADRAADPPARHRCRRPRHRLQQSRQFPALSPGRRRSHNPCNRNARIPLFSRLLASLWVLGRCRSCCKCDLSFGCSAGNTTARSPVSSTWQSVGRRRSPRECNTRTAPEISATTMRNKLRYSSECHAQTVAILINDIDCIARQCVQTNASEGCDGAQLAQTTLRTSCFL